MNLDTQKELTLCDLMTFLLRHSTEHRPRSFNTSLLRTKRIYDLSSKMSFPVPPQELQERPEEHFVQ